MLTIEDIIKSFEENYGIRRVNYRLSDLNVGKKYFIQIADAMLAWKGVKYDYSRTEKVIEQLIEWAYTIPGSNLDFYKGILLKGSTGRGKTFLFQVFGEFLKIDNIHFWSNGERLKMRLEDVNARRLAMEYEKDGYEAILKYSQKPVLVINDIGAENEQSQNYGNKTNIVDRLLDMREEKNLLTFGTTNLNKFGDNYDDRVISRMNSLFNVITMNHDIDYRAYGKDKGNKK